MPAPHRLLPGSAAGQRGPQVHDRLNEAGVALQRLRSPLERASAWDAIDGRPEAGSLSAPVLEADRLFHEAMDDDFNTARALGHLFDLSRVLNRAMDEGLGPEALAGARAMLGLGGVLGLFWKKPEPESWPAEILALVADREDARQSRDWGRADALRGRLLEMGVQVEDSPGGPKLKRRP